MESIDEPSRLRVLLIDDDEEDYFITRELLSEIERVRFEVKWIPNPDDALQHLRNGVSYDICLLDYRMGRRNGLDVLRDLVALETALPIIFLTGQNDSQVDQEAVRLGASDFLVKGQADAEGLERSIRYAIRQKKTEEELRRQTEFVSAVLDTAGALVLVLNRHSQIVRFNRACEKVSGYTFLEVEGQTCDLLVPAEIKPMVCDIFQRLVKGDFPFQTEFEWLTRQGARRRIIFNNTCLTDREGNVQYVVASGIDVTEQRRAEVALAEARDRELAVGASIQTTLLVRQPPTDIPGIEFGGVTQAAQRVGGDYLDFFVYDEDCIDVLIGDVMGKGVPAALLAAATKNHFQRAVRRLMNDLHPFGRLPEPREIVEAVHAGLTPELYRLCSFVTLNYSRFDLNRRTLTFVDCGHPGTIHINHEGSHRLLRGENLPLGVDLAERYQQKTLYFSPEDLFVFYSDGLFETADSLQEPFGMERLITEFQRHRSLSPQDIAEKVCAEVEEYGQNGSMEDDRTCVTVRIAKGERSLCRLIRRKEISARLNEVDDARAFIESALRQGVGADMEESAIFALDLAVHEAITNIIRHAYPPSANDGDEEEGSGETIQIQVACLHDRAVVDLRDTGITFVPPGKIPPPVLDGSREGGFGLFLIQQAVDEMSYHRDDFGRNQLRLTKLYSEGPGEQSLFG